MKKTFTAWIPEIDIPYIGKKGFLYGSAIMMPSLYDKKGLKKDWAIGRRPSVKVRVTVETIKK